jgi:hypothetical protein
MWLGKVERKRKIVDDIWKSFKKSVLFPEICIIALRWKVGSQKLILQQKKKEVPGYYNNPYLFIHSSINCW